MSQKTISDLPDSARGIKPPSHSRYPCYKSESPKTNGSQSEKRKEWKHFITSSENSIWSMNISNRLRRRDQLCSVRLQKLHSAAKTRLDNTIEALRRNYSRHTKQLTKEATFIEEEVKKREGEENVMRCLRFPTKSRRNAALPAIDKPEFYTLPVKSDSSASLSGHSECLFHSNGSVHERCLYFPCYLPVTYHSLGIGEKEKSFSTLHDYEKLLSRCSKVRPPSRKSDHDTSNDKPSTPSARVSIRDRERGLQQLIKEMKERNQKHRPRDWTTNYGEPLPRRLLLKPVTLVSESFIDIK